MSDEVYQERAQVVAALTHVWQSKGYSVYLGVDKENGWPVVYANLPTGQVSWHVSADDVISYFGHLGFPVTWAVWDGHDTPMKYQRLRDWAESL